MARRIDRVRELFNNSWTLQSGSRRSFKKEYRYKKEFSKYPLSERLSFIFIVLFICIILGCNIYGIRFFKDSSLSKGFYKHSDIDYREQDDIKSNSGGIDMRAFMGTVREAYREDPLDVDVFFNPSMAFRQILRDEKNYPLLRLESGRTYTMFNGNKYTIWGMR